MRITERRLRQLIRETLLVEAAYTPDRAAEGGLHFEVEGTRFGRGGYRIIASFKDTGMQVGNLSMSLPMPDYGNCLGAYEVSISNTSISGLGPLLYDIAMELAGPAGLMSDRKIVSPDAKRVWQYYYDNRSDVHHQQLDSKPGTITPDIEEDDCIQGSSIANAKRQPGETWQGSPLSKVYRKRGTPTIDRLRQLGCIEIK